MDPRLQRRCQRYGWDLAASDYERLWREPLRSARTSLLARVAPRAGERVLDVACGTGWLALDLAREVGPSGSVVGVDLSAAMIDAARRRIAAHGIGNAVMERMDAESLAFPDASFDVVVCALGLMYMPDPRQALREMARVLRPGGRIAVVVWGERRRCGWSPVLSIVEAEVTSDVCPLLFALGNEGTLGLACAAAGLVVVEQHRTRTTLAFADDDDASDAALVGGPAALAWSRFDADTRARVRERYLEAIVPWRTRSGYGVPGEFVLALATRDDSPFVV
ncbi:MAG TPA: methyltransferase domain-containing protein [Caldimonas sp.]